MARKLLKRRSFIAPLKKLKTVNYRKTSLGQWALMRLSQMHKCLKQIPYPEQFCKNHDNKFLHRKQLLNQLVGGFCLSSSAWANLSLKSGNTKFAEKGSYGQQKAHREPAFHNDGKLQDLSNLRQSTGEKPLHLIQLEKKTSRIGYWPCYGLKYKTATSGRGLPGNVAYGRNWKHIYSLDQLMCHQFEGQFRRRISHHKAQLMEKQKLKILYGTLSKRQSKETSNKVHPAISLSRMFESRLDVALKRCFVFTSLRNAQHWISLGRVLVNHKVVKSPSCTLQPGDLLSIDKTQRERYKTLFLNVFYKLNKETKYMQGGKLLSRWKDWANLYNYSSLHYKNTSQIKTGPADAPLKPWRTPATKVNAESFQSVSGKKLKHFWHMSGRSGLRCLQRDEQYTSKPVKPGKQNKSFSGLSFCVNLFRQLNFQKKRRLNIRLPRWLHWKKVYRNRILLFSRWLLSSRPLIRDGLYFLRWHRGFIRKKSHGIRGCHRHLTMQKPLHFEVSYKKLCALYLYPPQRIAWPCMINFKNK